MDKYRKYTKRIEDLITEFNTQIIIHRRRSSSLSSDFYYPEEVHDKIQGWLIKAENILNIIFPKESVQVKRFNDLRQGIKEGRVENRVFQIKGILEACLDDINNGFIFGQEFIIANEVFDSILEEAGFFLNTQKNKDIAAILLRIVLEDSLRRIAKREEINILQDDGKKRKTSSLNEDLKLKGIYNQTMWRQIQFWLDIGNDAAHGNFEKYTREQVTSFYDGITTFLGTYFN